MSLKYMCMLSHKFITHDVKPGFVNFSIYTEFWMGHLDISLSCVHIYCKICTTKFKMAVLVHTDTDVNYLVMSVRQNHPFISTKQKSS
jgi:hypothetical protein